MRKSGIIMHISSLPSDYGIGKLGRSAYAFADFLSDSGIQVWQVLPLSPTSYGDSPYQSFSVYAGNPYFIDFERLEQEGCLAPAEYKQIAWESDPRMVDYSRIYTYCFHVLRTAFSRFRRSSAAYLKFCKEQADWLPEYALFMALKDAHHGKPWYEWEPMFAMRDPVALERAREKYAEDIAFYCVLQYWFFQQWRDLKTYCNQKGISIVGDLPIYVAYDSVEVWSQPDLFQLNLKHVPIAVAGCPPDVFSPTGQLWGNPLYDWEYHKETGYAWWIQRLKAASEMYDTIRIDHFRGFQSYYAVGYGKKTAEVGTWQKGPGMELFDAVKNELGDLSIIAEDLGFVTPEVKQLLEQTGYPGMKVLQFAYDGDPKNVYLPQNYTTSNCVAYTGTHDNMTLTGWVHSASNQTVNFAKQHLHCRNASNLPSEILRAAWSSIADLAVAQMQDFLDAGPESRMNTPSTTGNNWMYRTSSTDFTPRLAKRIYRLNYMYNRLPEQASEKPAAAEKPARRKKAKKERGTV